jgi:hypothetical protein
MSSVQTRVGPSAMSCAPSGAGQVVARSPPAFAPDEPPVEHHMQRLRAGIAKRRLRFKLGHLAQVIDGCAGVPQIQAQRRILEIVGQLSVGEKSEGQGHGVCPDVTKFCSVSRELH